MGDTSRWTRDIRLWLAVVSILVLVVFAIFRNQIAGEDRWIAFGPHEIPAQAIPFSAPSTIVRDMKLSLIHI